MKIKTFSVLSPREHETFTVSDDAAHAAFEAELERVKKLVRADSAASPFVVQMIDSWERVLIERKLA